MNKVARKFLKFSVKKIRGKNRTNKNSQVNLEEDRIFHKILNSNINSTAIIGQIKNSNPTNIRFIEANSEKKRASLKKSNRVKKLNAKGNGMTEKTLQITIISFFF